MGFFGGKEIFVASTVYNMAGDVAGRPDYLKSLVAGNIISNTKFSMPETLQEGYMNGPGMKLRSFHRWALNNYGAIGVPNVEILNKTTFDQATIQTEFLTYNPPLPDHTYTVTNVDVRRYDIENFAMQYILDMGGGGLEEAWTVDVNPDGTTATITFPVATGFPPYVFTLPFPDDDGDVYIYVTYQVVIGTSPGPPGAYSKMWVYRVGSGNIVLDNIPEITIPTGSFLPFIPVRIDGEFLSDAHLPDKYDLAGKAYKKLTGQQLNKLIDQISENDDIDDIDHAFIVQGVALNCYENEGRKYLFKFFDYLMPYSNHRVVDFQSWRDGPMTTYTVTKFTYNGAYESYEGDSDAQYNYISMNDAPYYPSDKPLTSLSIRATGLLDTAKLWFIIKWSGISKFSGTGLKKPDAKAGDVWWTIGTSYTGEPGQVYNGGSLVTLGGEDQTITELHYQVTDTTWETLQFANLRHENRIYSKKSVEITAKEALTDTEETGFIVPFHYETLKSISLVESTQLSIASSYLVFNSYEVVKQKWYTTGFFKVIVIVAIIAITIAFPPAGGAVGLLGTAASVGATLGFTGLMAVIVGTIANALAAMLLTMLIQKVSTVVFGDKIGMIIAAVASVIAMNVGSTIMSGGSLAQSWGNLMSAANIINMTAAVGNGIAGYIQAGTQDWLGKNEELLEKYKKDSKALTDKWLETFGYGTFAFDPTMLTIEREADFLSRTLMTGSDIADMTLDMLTNFTDYTLKLDTISS